MWKQSLVKFQSLTEIKAKKTYAIKQKTENTENEKKKQIKNGRNKKK